VAETMLPISTHLGRFLLRSDCLGALYGVSDPCASGLTFAPQALRPACPAVDLPVVGFYPRTASPSALSFPILKDEACRASRSVAAQGWHALALAPPPVHLILRPPFLQPGLLLGKADLVRELASSELLHAAIKLLALIRRGAVALADEAAVHRRCRRIHYRCRGLCRGNGGRGQFRLAGTAGHCGHYDKRNCGSHLSQAPHCVRLTLITREECADSQYDPSIPLSIFTLSPTSIFRFGPSSVCSQV
jgi:hypothetical protein